jgi:ubiquinone/menaquinone biosynthesis C-methylase UbiE
MLSEKGIHELHWWLNSWLPTLEKRGYWEEHGILGEGESTRIGTLREQRIKEARARALRTAVMVGLPPDYLRGKDVLDIGPGPIGMLEMSGARKAYAVDPLADAYRQHGLLLEGGTTPVTWFTAGAEAIPLPDACVDVVVAFNCLDHVDNVQLVVNEISRVLRSGGSLLLNVELDHAPTPTEPHTLSETMLETLFRGYTRAYHRASDEGPRELTHGSRWAQARWIRS